MGLSNIDIEPIDAVLIALDPLDREPSAIIKCARPSRLLVNIDFQRCSAIIALF